MGFVSVGKWSVADQSFGTGGGDFRDVDSIQAADPGVPDAVNGWQVTGSQRLREGGWVGKGGDFLLFFVRGIAIIAGAYGIAGKADWYFGVGFEGVRGSFHDFAAEGRGEDDVFVAENVSFPRLWMGTENLRFPLQIQPKGGVGE